MPSGTDSPRSPSDSTRTDVPPDDDDAPTGTTGGTRTESPPPRGRDRRKRLRFAQARSVGILLVLLALLGLILYNTIAEGSPWVNRDRDVRLLMTLLSVLLGVDVVIGNHRAIARIVGELLIQYADKSEPPRNRHYEPDTVAGDQPTRDHDPDTTTSTAGTDSESTARSRSRSRSQSTDDST